MATVPSLCCPRPGPGLRPHPSPVSPAPANPNADFEFTCGVDPVTGHRVFTKWDLSQTPSAVVERLDATTGAPWSGDPTTLEPCGSSPLESDPVVMCESGTTFLRHVVKKNGEPTGVVFDTTLAGVPYTVADESLVTPGKCETSCAKAPQGVLTSWAI